ncbi:MAG TPA: glycoside hydrolase family 16 protein [Acidimicrobiales bacterium]|nr:glycoside hydrolase family 16 protein [Acidimicrobiales bacterium]
MRWGQLNRRVAAYITVCGLGASVALVPQAAVSTAGYRAVPVAALSPPEGTIPDLAALGWQPVFDENFDGTALDQSVWTVLQDDTHPVDGVHTRDTVGLDGAGHLKLSSYSDANGQDHVSSLFTGGIGDSTPTPGGFEAAYGYVEASINFPDGPASSSTFWTMSANGTDMPLGDPAASGPEIDIVEHANLPATGLWSGDFNADGRCDWPATATLPCKETFLAGGHWNGVEEDHVAMHEISVENPNPSVSLQGNYHRYGVLWTPEEYRYFVDGIEVKRTAAGQSYGLEYLVLQTYILDAASAEFGPLGSPANDVTYVDYVKVWQRPISEVPDQSTPADSTLSLPFTVQDYNYGSAERTEPGSVNVRAMSWTPDLVPNGPEGLAVSGNGPADPDGAGPLEATDGSFADGGFEGSGSWGLSGGATVSSGNKHTGDRALSLTQGGGRAAQTITDLRPSTTYLVGAHYDLGLGFDDLNANGRIDGSEGFTETGDGSARFDWGVSDVDTAQPGVQEVRTQYERNGWDEQAHEPWWERQSWPHEYVKFTTGPTTTSVELFFDNTAYVGKVQDSDVAIDSVSVRPVVNPQRTVAVRPVAGRTGDAWISLVASDASGREIGSETFRLRVGAGTLGDGSFEAGEAATPWVMSPTADVVVPQPFRGDHQLRLGATGNDTVTQHVTGLAAGTRYRLETTAQVARAGGGFGVYVQHHDGANGLVGMPVRSTTSETAAVEFITGPATTTADVLLADWNTGDGASLVEDVTLRQCATVDSCAEVATTQPEGGLPDLAAVGTQRGVSGVPLNIGANLPEGATLTGVTSTNPVLIPDLNIAVTGAGRRQAFTVTPVQDRTGAANIRVAYTGAAGSPVDIPVVVSAAALLQPGFEKGANGWGLSGTAAVDATGPHGGAQALRLDGAGAAVQRVAGLPHLTRFVLGAWVDGTADVTLRTVPVDDGEQSETLASAQLSGSGWTEQDLAFTTFQCTDCMPEDWRPVEVVISDADPGDGVPVRVDDLSLVHTPGLARIRDLSIHSGSTDWDWTSRRLLLVGRVGENAMWDDAVRSVTTADVAGFGTGVVPVANLRGPYLPDDGWPFRWGIEAKAGDRTGRSDVTVTLTDPATGNQRSETYAVTVNAGDNFDNGDFERSTLGAINTGWTRAWFNDSHDIVKAQAWQYLGQHNTHWPYVGPRDDGRVLRLSSGAAKHSITGLTPGTEYRVRLRAKGSGSTVEVRSGDAIVEAPVLGAADIAPPNGDNVWRDYTFTFTTAASGEGSTSVVLFMKDADLAGAAVPGSTWPCAQYMAGETCFDDVGVFEVADVG